MVVVTALSGCTLFPDSAPARVPESQVEPPKLPPSEVFTPKPSSPPGPQGSTVSSGDAVAGSQVTGIVPGGGVADSADHKFHVTFPPGALTAPVNVTVTKVAPSVVGDAAEDVALGDAFNVSEDGAEPSLPLNANLSVPPLEVARLNLSQGLPLMGFYYMPGTGAPRPLGGALTFDLAQGNVTVAATLSKLGLLYLRLLNASVTLSPWDATAFVGEPWPAAAFFRLGEGRGTVLRGMHAFSTGPVETLTPDPHAGDITASTRVDLQFRCTASGDGSFGVTFALAPPDAGPDNNATVAGTLEEPVHCLRKPTLTGTLSPPQTLFHVAATVPEGPTPADSLPARIFYDWHAAIGCGIFNATGLRKVVFDGLRFPFAEADADWSHPNAGSTDPATKDNNGDGIPDTCPHSETPNFSHPGTITAYLEFRKPVSPRLTLAAPDPESDDDYDPFYAGEVSCTYSGSLSGTGTCAPYLQIPLVALLRVPGA